MGIPSLIVDVSEEHLQCAKVKGLNTYNGQVLSEQLQFEVDMDQYEYLIAVTDTDSYNVLVANTYVPQFGHHNTFYFQSMMWKRLNKNAFPFRKSSFTVWSK